MNELLYLCWKRAPLRQIDGAGDAQQWRICFSRRSRKSYRTVYTNAKGNLFILSGWYPSNKKYSCVHEVSLPFNLSILNVWLVFIHIWRSYDKIPGTCLKYNWLACRRLRHFYLWGRVHDKLLYYVAWLSTYLFMRVWIILFYCTPYIHCGFCWLCFVLLCFTISWTILTFFWINNWHWTNNQNQHVWKNWTRVKEIGILWILKIRQTF